MSGIDYAILAVVAVCFVLAVVSVVRNRKKGCCSGSGNCCANCAECAKRGKCRAEDTQKDK